MVLITIAKQFSLRKYIHVYFHITFAKILLLMVLLISVLLVVCKAVLFREWLPLVLLVFLLLFNFLLWLTVILNYLWVVVLRFCWGFFAVGYNFHAGLWN